MAEYYVGLMSGTSLDAVDAVVVDFDSFPPRCVATHSLQIAPELKRRILSLCRPGKNEIERMGQLDVELGRLFARAASEVVEQAGLRAAEVSAIGSHGQTIRHEPQGHTPFTLQIGDPNTIAQQSGITTVADFRRRDLTLGGQGAPLAPAYHRWFLQGQGGALVNIGGMANVTLLSADSAAEVVGFDTGPGNVLIDYWMEQAFGEAMDRDGATARSGQLSEPLLAEMLKEPFFQQLPPKSTGRETFNAEWLQRHAAQIERLVAVDVAATLVELTATTIAEGVSAQGAAASSLWVCGGGAHNRLLLERIAAHLPGWQVASSAEVGMDPDWVEAMAFAWLARQTLHGESGNLPSVTGAAAAVILGAIYPV
jgi:anhydro-N-acetylmuramic acid kinase